MRMPWEPKESASDVRREYRSRINGFLHDVNGYPAGSLRREKPLDALITWGHDVAEENRRLKADLNLQRNATQQGLHRIEELEQSVATLQSRYRQVHEDRERVIAQHEDRITKLTMKHSKDMNEMIQNYKHTIKSEQDDRETERRKLVDQLLVNTDDNSSWPDDKLKVNFKELQHLIENITSPQNKALKIPEYQRLGPNLDPSDCLSRIGHKKSHLLLKDVIWTIFGEQFFSLPFGFGALGPGKGQKELMNVYMTWMALFEPIGTVAARNEQFAIFKTNRQANTWRSSMFRGINEALDRSRGQLLSADTQVARCSAENVEVAVHRVMSVFSEVASLSNASVGMDVESKVRHIANLAAEIALQFGVQPAQLQFSVPRRGDKVRIGDEYHDTGGGDFSKGALFTVDLVTLPGIRKIGDGRSDLTSTRTIVPCEIYSI